MYGLTSLYIEKLHDVGIEIFFGQNEPVGAGECIDRNLLHSAALQPFQSTFGHDAYPTIYDKAACLFFSIAGGHIFTNGNKRTSVLALLHFLLANEILLVLSNEEMVDLTRSTAAYRSTGNTAKEMMCILSQKIKEGSIAFSELSRSNHETVNDWTRIMHDMRNAGTILERSVLEQQGSR